MIFFRSVSIIKTRVRGNVHRQAIRRLSPQIDSQALKLAEKQFLDLVPKQMCRFAFGLFKFANWSLTNSLPPNKMFIPCPCHHAPPQYYTVCICICTEPSGFFPTF
jgi:hypothetical protein